MVTLRAHSESRHDELSHFFGEGEARMGAGVSLSTDALEAGLRFLLHPAIESCLELWRISPSQMVPNSWRYLLPDRVDHSDSEQLRTGVVNRRDQTSQDPLGDPFYFEGGEGHERGLVGRGGSQPCLMWELEKVPKRGYTMKELCEVEDREGANRYFTSIMMRLKCTDGEDPLVLRWSTISGSSPFWTEGPFLDGARDDRARLEGDILSLIEAATFLKTELKAEGQKAVAAYKASQGFKSDLEKMGRISYEFGY
ncbi:hypothetical protein B296_00027126 [Ensete ventricosum]|uniref:Uncharacterized protein n=1 Tax=Ensete ventricosum TaxID=4639 RepID=A0A426YK55_ENSVE|nr:hypothetical protein B296_00027126 [Ensete ventricosum]